MGYESYEVLCVLVWEKLEMADGVVMQLLVLHTPLYNGGALCLRQ